MTILLAILSQQMTVFWIGLNDLKDEGTFVWQDGTARSQSYVKWKTNYPKEGTDEHCVLRRGNKEWRNTECDRSVRFFCSMQLQIHVMQWLSALLRTS